MQKIDEQTNVKIIGAFCDVANAPKSTVLVYVHPCSTIIAQQRLLPSILRWAISGANGGTTCSVSGTHVCIYARKFSFQRL